MDCRLVMDTFQEELQALRRQENREVRGILSHARLSGERPNFARHYWVGVYMADFHTDYTNAIFDRGILTRTDFSDVDLTGASFKRATGNYLVAEDATLVNADFTGANLTRSKFERSNLAGIDFTDADLTGATFTDTDLTNAIFTGATLTGATFVNITVCGESFTGSSEIFDRV
jgi:uncharacterized protein YjbI with pentapeptide repeats